MASLSTKIRLQQDTVGELRRQIAAGEKRERQAGTAQQAAETRATEAVQRVQVLERELAGVRGKAQDLEAAVRRAEADKKAALQGIALSSDVQSSALAAAKGACTGRGGHDKPHADEATRATLALNEAHVRAQQERSSLEGQLRAAQQQLEQAEMALQQVQRQADEARGAYQLPIGRAVHVCTAALAEQLAAGRAQKSLLDGVQREFGEYKLRAAKILQSKEKIISDMRAAGGVAVPDGSVDVVQLQSERDVLHDQLAEASATIEQLRNDIRVCRMPSHYSMNMCVPGARAAATERCRHGGWAVPRA